MPFVTRDGDGRVVALSEMALEEDAEFLSASDDEVSTFIATLATEGAEGGDPFLLSDLRLIRVIEDVVEVLIRKNVLTLTDLPSAAQDKLMERRALRHWLAGIAGVVEDDEGKII
ncbi:MAG: hypothetical protein HY985_12040 [Magnetospirillum sp.]|nr:hypothetical protein [Magnetospirillum sp.]